MRPAVDALSRRFDVRTFSLNDAARSLDDYRPQVSHAIDDARVDSAVICGVSFGGLVALRFAATQPARTRALVLASTPGPGFSLRPRHRIYARLPWLCGPLFLAESPWRLRREIAAAFPDPSQRRAFRRAALATVVRAPLSLSAMGRRALLMGSHDAAADCARVTAPTLVVTGEPSLDYVVPVDGSSAYAQMISGARAAVLERTGHIGTITRPDAFALLVGEFVERAAGNANVEARNPKLGTPDAAA